MIGRWTFSSKEVATKKEIMLIQSINRAVTKVSSKVSLGTVLIIPFVLQIFAAGSPPTSILNLPRHPSKKFNEVLIFSWCSKIIGKIGEHLLSKKTWKSWRDRELVHC